MTIDARQSSRKKPELARAANTAIEQDTNIPFKRWGTNTHPKRELRDRSTAGRNSFDLLRQERATAESSRVANQPKGTPRLAERVPTPRLVVRAAISIVCLTIVELIAPFPAW